MENVMSGYDSGEDTRKHIKQVQQYLAIMFNEIAKRYDGHDASKLESPEKETLDRVTPLLRGLTYGSAEYKAVLANMQEALEHHYEHNRHHPEHFKGTKVQQAGETVDVQGAGMRGMTLVDLVEMFCDWCAATERHEDGDIGKSIDYNIQRFGFGETLASIMVNTAQEYGMGRRSHLACRPSPSLNCLICNRMLSENIRPFPHEPRICVDCYMKADPIVIEREVQKANRSA